MAVLAVFIPVLMLGVVLALGRYEDLMLPRPGRHHLRATGSSLGRARAPRRADRLPGRHPRARPVRRRAPRASRPARGPLTRSPAPVRARQTPGPPLPGDTAPAASDRQRRRRFGVRLCGQGQRQCFGQEARPWERRHVGPDASVPDRNALPR